MYRQIVEDVLEKFAVTPRRIGDMQKGYRNESYPITLMSGHVINLLFHKHEPEALERIRRSDRAAAISGDADLPVRTRFDPRTLKLKNASREVYACLYTYLPGSTIPWEAYTKDHIKLLGWAMSDMHAAWQTQAIPSLYIVDELRELLTRMKRYLASTDVTRAMRDKLGVTIDAAQYLDQLTDILELCRTLPNQHILHMDMVRGNLLFRDATADDRWTIDTDALCGVIDFEKVSTGHPIFDIARTLTFLLVDCAVKAPEKIYKYFIESGYNKRGASSFSLSDELAGMKAYELLGALTGLFLLHDFYKFLRHTPYESLNGNHHYCRTRDMLVDYGIIRYHKD